MTAFYGKKLSTAQKGMITVNTLKELIGDPYGAVCERMAILSEQKSPEFLRGMKHGANVAMLMSNRPNQELLADPDVQEALREAPETTAFIEKSMVLRLWQAAEHIPLLEAR